jgi:hypothetical protein
MCGNVRYEVQGDSEAAVRTSNRIDDVVNKAPRFSATAPIAARSEAARTPVTQSTLRMVSRSLRARLSSTRRWPMAATRSSPISGMCMKRRSAMWV